MPEWDKEFELLAVNANTPAVARIMITRKVDGNYELLSTLDPEQTVGLLDQAMEATDGQRLPPDSNGG